MSIDRMERVLLAVPSTQKDTFVDWLYREREVHLEEFKNTEEQWSERFRPMPGDSALAESKAAKLQGSIEFFNEVHKLQSDFLEGIFPVKLLATEKEIGAAVNSVVPEEMAIRCQQLQAEIESAVSEREKISSEISRLWEIDFINVNLSSLKNLRHVSFLIANVSGTAQKSFLYDSRLAEEIYVEAVSVSENTTRYVIVSPTAQKSIVQDVLADYGIAETIIPAIDNTVAGQIVNLKTALSEAESKEKVLREEAVAFATEWRKKAELALSFWESERSRVIQQGYMNGSKNIFTAVGYIRTVRLERFQARLSEAFPSAEVINLGLAEDIDPPVNVTWSNFFRPMGLLVRMFGLPTYKSIDPTVYLSLTFIIFFGICFGDILYGAMLVALAAWLKKRFRDQQGLVQFFRLFTYAGVSTIIFGFAMGSWGADLTSYFGKGNFLDTLRLKMTLLDPLAKPVVALAIAVGIGVVNQFYGIFMRFLQSLFRKDYAAAIYDGVFWLGYLGTLLGACLSLAFSGPKVLTLIFGIFFILFTIGLVLTQGRDQKAWGPRLFTGFISLYGIMGTYGTTSFMGDVISYSRLMALGMTTSVVGMSFNIIAGLLKDIPYVGYVLFIGMVVFGHVFNFSMSIMSAFVHSARLILLEWFGRFYEGGGVQFMPFGFHSARLDIVEAEKA